MVIYVYILLLATNRNFNFSLTIYLQYKIQVCRRVKIVFHYQT